MLDLDFDGVYEYDATNDVMGLNWSFGRSGQRDTIGVSTLTYTAFSDAGKYQLDRTSSSLFPNWVVGRRFIAQATVGGNTYSLFKGRVQDITEDVADDRAIDQREVSVVVHDDVEILQAADIKVGVLQGKNYSDLVNAILDAANWPGARLVAATQSEQWLWWPDGSALNAINAVIESEMGLFWVDGSGKAYYQDRHWRFNSSRALTPVATFNADLSTLNMNQDTADIFTFVDVTVAPLKSNPIGVLWTESENPLVLAPLDSRVIQADYSGPAYNVLTPVSSTDYKATDAGGTDQTSLLSVVSDLGPTKAFLTVKNTSSSVSLKVTLLQLRGQPLTQDTEFTAKASATPFYLAGYWIMGTSTLGTTTILAGSPETFFMKNELHLTPQMLHSKAIAQDIANGVLARFGRPQTKYKMVIDGMEDEITQTVLGLQISDRITVNVSSIGIAMDFWVESFNHEVSANGADYVHNVTMDLTPTYMESYWILDQSQLNIDAKLGW